MLVFLDDSGDPGFKVEKGSSPVFIISLVIFEDALEAEKTAIAVKELRRELKHSDSFEFRFNKTPKKEVLRFLEVINKFDWKYRAIIMQKKVIRSKELQGSKESFYNSTIKMVLKNSGNVIKKAKLRMDGKGSREFRRKLLTYLRKDLPEGMVDNLRFRDSKSDVLVQMADIVAGSIHRKYQEKSDKDSYLAKIKKHESDLWEFK